MKILQDAGILTPKGGVAKSAEQAYEIASLLGELMISFFPILVTVNMFNVLHSSHT